MLVRDVSNLRLDRSARLLLLHTIRSTAAALLPGKAQHSVSAWVRTSQSSHCFNTDTFSRYQHAQSASSKSSVTLAFKLANGGHVGSALFATAPTAPRVEGFSGRKTQSFDLWVWTVSSLFFIRTRYLPSLRHSIAHVNTAFYEETDRDLGT